MRRLRRSRWEGVRDARPGGRVAVGSVEVRGEMNWNRGGEFVSMQPRSSVLIGLD